MKNRLLLILAGLTAFALLAGQSAAPVVTESLQRVQTDPASGQVSAFYQKTVVMADGTQFQQAWSQTTWALNSATPVTITLADGTTAQTTRAAVFSAVVAIANAEHDIESLTMVYRPDLGNPTSEASGRSILAQKSNSDNSHFNYFDNLARSVRRTALIELDLIPAVYSEQRAITIYDPDQKVRSVQINAQILEKGTQRIYDLAQQLGAARYDVVMKSGPSYATRRQEGAAALMDLIKFIPGPMSRALDLLVGYLDIPDQDALAARLRPADIPADGGGPTIQQLTQQNQQMQQLIQQLTQSVNALSDKTAAERLKLASQERVAIHGDFAGILEALIKAKSSGAEALLSEVAETLRQREAQLAASQETANPDAAGSQPQGQPAAPPAPAQPAPGPTAQPVQ